MVQWKESGKRRGAENEGHERREKRGPRKATGEFKDVVVVVERQLRRGW
jgi:hypothetical protein